MTHIDIEIQKIKKSALEMMNMVRSQLQKGKEALVEFNKEIALEVMHNEKRVNGYELIIDNDCENLIALFSPVAVDLRFVLATLKINYHIERIGDNADGIARNVLDLNENWNPELLTKLELVKAFDMADDMFNDVIASYETENTSLARTVFKKDKILDQITFNAFNILAENIREHPEKIEHSLYLLLIHRKLERIGDLIKNIAEETIFYIEAKVLKHKSKKDRTEEGLL